MTGSLIVGTDGSDVSNEALRYAVQEARAHDLELIVVISYIGPIDPDVDDFEKPKEQWIAAARAKAEAALARALGLRPEDVPAHQVVADEMEFLHLLLHVAHAIDDVRQVVVGQHHEHLLERVLHGPSKAASLARKSHVPVTIVPQSFHQTSEVDQ